jgi:hypothetical protein
MLQKVTIFSMNTKFVFHEFSFSFVASHIMLSYFGFETCVNYGNGTQKVLGKCTLCNSNGTFGVVDIIGQHVRVQHFF